MNPGARIQIPSLTPKPKFLKVQFCAQTSGRKLLTRPLRCRVAQNLYLIPLDKKKTNSLFFSRSCSNFRVSLLFPRTGVSPEHCQSITNMTDHWLSNCDTGLIDKHRAFHSRTEVESPAPEATTTPISPITVHGCVTRCLGSMHSNYAMLLR